MNEAVAAVTRPAETSEVHTRLLKCSLAIDESRAYWSHYDPSDQRNPTEAAFEEYWFGARSHSWIAVIITNMRARYDTFPSALATLARWKDMSPAIRQLICHWHLQLTDPLYRDFSGTYLVQRRDGLRPEVYRQAVISWVTETCPGRWTTGTRTQFATRLLSCALAAGLVKSKRDPRELSYPRVPDEALAYLLYLLRDVDFDGSLAQNPYLSSVGLRGGILADRLRTLDCVTYRRVGDTHNFEWRYPDLEAWADAELPGVAA